MKNKLLYLMTLGFSGASIIAMNQEDFYYLKDSCNLKTKENYSLTMFEFGEQWRSYPAILFSNNDIIDEDSVLTSCLKNIYEPVLNAGVRLNNNVRNKVYYLFSKKRDKIKKDCKKLHYKKSNLDSLLTIIERVVTAVDLSQEWYAGVDLYTVLFSNSSNVTSSGALWYSLQFLSSLYDNHEKVVFNGEKIDPNLSNKDIFDNLVSDFVDYSDSYSSDSDDEILKSFKKVIAIKYCYMVDNSYEISSSSSE